MNSPEIDPDTNQHALQVVEVLTRAGFRALWAGGCVRDLLLGRDFSDVDIATSATPDEVEALFDHTHAIGKAFGVIQVVMGDDSFEVASFREDRDYTDGRHPDRIVPSTAEKDASRRDFTINGLFLDPLSGEILDVVGGQEDLKKKRIRAIGDPDLRFREDHLRMLRAVRFSSVLQFEIDPATFRAIQNNAHRIATVSPERIQSEVVRTLTESPRPGDALTLWRETGILQHLLPEMLDTVGCEQPPEYHPEGDVWTHTVLMLNELEQPSPALALAVLFHDIGKPETRTVDPDGRIRFMGHAQAGAAIADRWLTAHKFPNALRSTVVGFVNRHMDFMNVPHMRPATLKKTVARPEFEDELELHRIDCLCSNGITRSVEILRQAREEFEKEAALPSPRVNGKDLLSLGLPPGPEIGTWKDAAYEHQLENPTLGKEDLLAWVSRQRSNEGTPAPPPAAPSSRLDNGSP
jgi:poly(A) polymerase